MTRIYNDCMKNLLAAMFIPLMVVGYGKEAEKKVVEDEISSSETVPQTDISFGPKPFTIPDLSMAMVWVKPGTFEMGSPSGEKGRNNDETLHTVTLTDGYWLGKHEVTQSQWKGVMGNNPSRIKGPDRPVEQVSWNDVTSFCKKLTEQESKADRLPPGMSYQLPTEAQWEYACRAETKTAYAFGESLTSAQANIVGGSSVSSTTNVGKYPANAWGFYDMHGNVEEWCADWYGDYPRGTARNPLGDAFGSSRVYRGGSWGLAGDARSANRRRREPTDSFLTLGFRLSLRQSKEEQALEEDALRLLDALITAIESEKLQGRENLWYAPNQQPPYTGLAKVMYDNGQIHVLTHYKNGKPDGLVTKWYESGQKESEGNLKNGKTEGFWAYWHKNGKKSIESNFKGGKPHGLSIAWYENGQKKLRVNFKDGRLDGLWTGWYENGKKRGERNYKKGRTDGFWISYYLNGNTEKSEIHKDGKLNGLKTEWYKHGQKRWEVNFKDGKMDGLWTEWYENGFKILESNFKNGKQDGVWTSWYTNGQKRDKRTFKDDKFMFAVVWKPNGEKCPVTNVVNGNGVWVKYYPDGTEKERLNYKDGELVKD